MDLVGRLRQMVVDTVTDAAHRVCDPIVKVATQVVDANLNSDELDIALTDLKAVTVGLSDDPVAADVGDLTDRIEALLFNRDRDVNVVGQLEKKSLTELKITWDKLLRERRATLREETKDYPKTLWDSLSRIRSSNGDKHKLMEGPMKNRLYRALDRIASTSGNHEQLDTINELWRAAQWFHWEYSVRAETAEAITLALEHNLSGQVIETLRPVAATSGDPERLDSADELWRAAKLFGQVSRIPAIQRLQTLTDVDDLDEGPDSKLRITPTEAHTYLELRRLLPAIQKELGISQVHHPLAAFVKRLPLLGLDQWRSLQVFDGYAEKLSALLNKTGNRNPTLLYPASGNHYAPLQTMMRLIDLGAADSVTMVGTDLEFDRGDMVRTLKALKHAGVVESIDTPPPTTMSFSRGGSEQIFKMHYRGKSITIEMAIGRSGEEYFLPKDFKRAVGVIIHDPDSIHAKNTYKLLSSLAAAEINVGDKNERLMLMEGTPGPNYIRGFTMGSQTMRSDPQIQHPMLGVSPERIQGTYGHCKDTFGDIGVGEIFACAYESAFVFALNDSRFLTQIGNARTPDEIFKRIYDTGSTETTSQSIDPEARCHRWE